uniref:Uncharacterized protein n=1 Tax=Parascaris univalens TaxID=6257 RepID=A0A915C8H6_PARUN
MTSAAQAALEEFLIPLPAEVNEATNGSMVTSTSANGGESTAAAVKVDSAQGITTTLSAEGNSELPVSPMRNPSMGPFTDSKPPESPDMKFARTRLGHLLSGIRTGEIQAGTQPARGLRRPGGVDIEDDVSQAHARMRKALRRERRVVFELRGKPFGLRDNGHNEAIFSLCRTWMRGKEEELPKDDEPEVQYPQPTDDSLDLLATKEILALPRPHDMPEASPAPPAFPKTPSGPELDINNSQALLNDLLPHWRAVKKNWCDYTKIRDKRFEKSIRLLETVYGIAQQNVI